MMEMLAGIPPLFCVRFIEADDTIGHRQEVLFIVIRLRLVRRWREMKPVIVRRCRTKSEARVN